MVRAACIAYIELIRGVPLISVLFMASVMLPLFLPAGVTIDKLLRAQIALILFAAAYLAEVVRGGLQAIPHHQYEAAEALGLSYWQRTLHVILPQALRIVDPAAGEHLHRPLQGHLAGADHRPVRSPHHHQGLAAGPGLAGFGVEAYLFASAVYFAFCYAMSRYSRGLEQGGPGRELQGS